MIRTIAVAAVLAGLWGGVAAAEATIPYVCTAGSTRSYSATPGGANCKPVQIEAGWQPLFAAPAFYATFHPASVVRDGDMVKAWIEMHLAAVAADNRGRFRYDAVRATYRFSCQRREQTLIQGTYSLGSRVVYDRLSREAVLEEVEPGTVSDALLRFFCQPGG